MNIIDAIKQAKSKQTPNSAGQFMVTRGEDAEDDRLWFSSTSSSPMLTNKSGREVALCINSLLMDNYQVPEEVVDKRI